ncbi:hypothetical protein PV08_11099 [Exophiala spinifera]|uniref:Uncharacterized protein n=1 Tax=Exophiala spinifera TaxID=91928 RepID=A0A0D2ATS9_9EURO|nr:uncharacterized protein PV08_11099 [Exophiala spinifera]KIW10138.1 hypothetical protein PV08_11099 [Exophiala spinifera]
MNILDAFYRTDGSKVFADNANRVLRNLGMAEAYDVISSRQDDIVGTIAAAMMSAESHGDHSQPTEPQTPRHQKIGSKWAVEPESRVPKTEGSSKRIVVKDEAYKGSPTTSRRQKPFLYPALIQNTSPSRAVSCLGMHGFAPPSLPRVPSLMPRLLFPSAQERSQQHRHLEESGDHNDTQLHRGDEASEKRIPVIFPNVLPENRPRPAFEEANAAYDAQFGQQRQEGEMEQSNPRIISEDEITPNRPHAYYEQSHGEHEGQVTQPRQGESTTENRLRVVLLQGAPENRPRPYFEEANAEYDAQFGQQDPVEQEPVASSPRTVPEEDISPYLPHASYEKANDE